MARVPASDLRDINSRATATQLSCNLSHGSDLDEIVRISGCWARLLDETAVATPQ